MTDSYYIPAPEGGFACQGYLLTCSKCGKKIIVETVINGTNHNVSVMAICADCVELNNKFKEGQPELAKEIQDKIDAFKEEK
ncbi:MAG: hypothetical protein M0R80_00570 [Proteobacteria bacterium]|jgi:hypothetical protein|nr:hypothetical protein [Pseudomonadota bacterium]